jgi:hypothetical protein
MYETSDLTANTLLKKLSTLRGTLPNNECQLLDDLLCNQGNEVAAHEMSLDKASRRIMYDPDKGEYLLLEA